MLVARQLPHEHHVPAKRYWLSARRDGADALAQRVRGHFSGMGGDNKQERGESRYHDPQHGHHATAPCQARGPGVV